MALRTPNDQATLSESILPAEVLRLPAELERVEAQQVMDEARRRASRSRLDGRAVIEARKNERRRLIGKVVRGGVSERQVPRCQISGRFGGQSLKPLSPDARVRIS